MAVVMVTMVWLANTGSSNPEHSTAVASRPLPPKLGQEALGKLRRHVEAVEPALDRSKMKEQLRWGWPLFGSKSSPGMHTRIHN